MKASRYIAVAGAVLLAAAANAQNLSTEVVVDRTVIPDLPAATPLAGVVPGLLPSASGGASLTPVDYTLGSDFAVTVDGGDAYRATGLALDSLSRGFAWLGYFPAYNLTAGVGYSLLHSERRRLTLAADYNGSSWHTPVIGADAKGTAAVHSFDILADYGLRLASGARLAVKAAYGRESAKRPDSPVMGDFDRSVDKVDLSAAISREGLLAYDARLWWAYTGGSSETPARDFEPLANKENNFGFEGRLSTQLGEKGLFGLGLGADFLHNDAPYFEHGNMTGHNAMQGIITLNPAFDFNWRGFALRVGVKAQLGIGTPGAKLRVAPDVSLDTHLGRRVQFYAGFGGGQSFNTARRMLGEWSFAPLYAAVQPAYTPVDARAGLRFGSFGGLTADVYAGYASTHHAARPAVVVVPVVGGSMPQVNLLSAFNLSGWYAGLRFAFEGNGPVEGHIEGRCMASGVWSGFADDSDGAKAVIDAAVTARVDSRLRIGVDYRLRACRSYRELGVDGTWHLRNMGNISSPGISASYALTQNLSVLLRVDNLLCRRYELYPGVASRRLQGLLAATLRF